MHHISVPNVGEAISLVFSSHYLEYFTYCLTHHACPRKPNHQCFFFMCHRRRVRKEPGAIKRRREISQLYCIYTGEIKYTPVPVISAAPSHAGRIMSPRTWRDVIYDTIPVPRRHGNSIRRTILRMYDFSQSTNSFLAQAGYTLSCHAYAGILLGGYPFLWSASNKNAHKILGRMAGWNDFAKWLCLFGYSCLRTELKSPNKCNNVSLEPVPLKCRIVCSAGKCCFFVIEDINTH